MKSAWMIRTSPIPHSLVHPLHPCLWIPFHRLLSLLPDLLCKNVDLSDLLATTSPLRFHNIMLSQASMVLHRVGPTVITPFLSLQELLGKSVDSPNQLATASPLRLHHITPSQASMVLHGVSYATLSPGLLPVTEFPELLALKTHWLGSLTSILTSLCSFECGL